MCLAGLGDLELSKGSQRAGWEKSAQEGVGVGLESSTDRTEGLACHAEYVRMFPGSEGSYLAGCSGDHGRRERCFRKILKWRIKE